MDKKIKYIYIDLDGTSFTSEKTMTSETIDIINKLKNKGIKIGIATGRPYFMIKREINNIKPSLPTISSNGALVLDNDGSILFSARYKSNMYHIIIKYLNKNKLNYLCYNTEGMYRSKDNCSYFNTLIEWQKAYKIDELWNISPINELLEDDLPFKITVPITSKINETKDLIKKISPQLDVVSSQAELIDIMPKGISKGNAIKKVLISKNINQSEVLFIGDNENDVSAFNVIENSVAMLNSTPKVKKSAKFCTKYDNNSNGVYYFLKDFFKNDDKDKNK